jgi:hypothetical protein
MAISAQRLGNCLSIGSFVLSVSRHKFVVAGMKGGSMIAANVIGAVAEVSWKG